MRVLMIDDHVMFLQGMKTLFGQLVPGVAVDGVEEIAVALEAVGRSRYDLVLLDWHLADSEGDDALVRLRDTGCDAPIVVLSGETNPVLIRRALDVGAAGFIPKTYSSEMMISALNRVLDGCISLPINGGAPPPPRTLSAEFDSRLAGLTQRQLDVYRAAARGLPNKMIARELGIAGSTVKSHLAAVFAALGVHNRTEAAFQASREGVRLFEPLQ